MPILVSSLLTLATALAVGLVLIPTARLALAAAHGRLADLGTRAAHAGGAGVLLAVAALAPMGGDGVVVEWSDDRLASGLVLAAGLLVLGMLDAYRRLELRPRLVLQALLAGTATLVGLQPTGVSPPPVAGAVGTIFLVGCTNLLRASRRPHGHAPAQAAIAAGFLAIAAQRLGVLAWWDLNLALCGALLALLAYARSRERWRAHLGEGGRLAVGFLLGLTILRLSAAAAPGTRLSLLFVLVLPGLDASLRLARRTSWAFAARLPTSLFDLLLAQGVTPRRARLLLLAAGLVAGIASLRFLHVLD